MPGSLQAALGHLWNESMNHFQAELLFNMMLLRAIEQRVLQLCDTGTGNLDYLARSIAHPCTARLLGVVGIVASAALMEAAPDFLRLHRWSLAFIDPLATVPTSLPILQAFTRQASQIALYRWPGTCRDTLYG